MNTTIKGAMTFRRVSRDHYQLTLTPLTGEPLTVDFIPTAPAVPILTTLFTQAAPPVEQPAPREAADPWIREVYSITTEYHIDTGRKVMIGDLLEAFFAQTVHDVDPGDRDAFMVQLKQRLA